MESFDGIYLDLSSRAGRCRFADSGFGWKPSSGGDTFTMNKESIGQASWSRAARGYELKILERTSGIILLSGFKQDDFEGLMKLFKNWYGVGLENREHALRGWNWGKAEFGKAELSFNIGSRPAFEVPYTEIANTNLAGKNEVSVDFMTGDGDKNAANPELGGARAKGRKLAAARDQLVEARFYIPGTTVKPEKEDKEDGEDAEENGDGEDGAEEQNAANVFYETLVDKAEIGDVAGDTFATFMDVLHLTPRGRFDIDMYEKSFRLRGKTYDYKIQYDSIKKFFLLPKSDDVHTLITIGLEPPLRQGQTRYPFVVMQFKRDEDIELDLNVSEEDLENKYKDKLNPTYSGPIFIVLTHLFRGLAGKKVISPSKDFLSRHGQTAVKCSIKANEGHLYCMDRSFMFVPKPATYVAIDHVAQITMSRVGGAVSASRTFDITMTLKGGAGEHQFSNINREEQQPLEDFFKAKGIKVRNQMAEEAATSKLVAKALKDESDSDEEVAMDRGSADEDSEEEDEDFQADDESDVAEEYDSAHSSKSGSDVEMEDADGSADDDDDEADEDTGKVEPPPKKKAKTGR